MTNKTGELQQVKDVTFGSGEPAGYSAPDSETNQTFILWTVSLCKQHFQKSDLYTMHISWPKYQWMKTSVLFFSTNTVHCAGLVPQSSAFTTTTARIVIASFLSWIQARIYAYANLTLHKFDIGLKGRHRDTLLLLFGLSSAEKTWLTRPDKTRIANGKLIQCTSYDSWLYNS